MGFGEKKEKTPLIEQKMKEKEDILKDIDFTALYTDDVKAIKHRGKKVIMVYGDKNDGKTVVAYGVMDDNDTALVLSFDNMSDRPIDDEEGLSFLKDAPLTIKVINASQYYSTADKVVMLETAALTYAMVDRVLNDYTDPKNTEAKINGERPDWVIIDGTERMTRILEMCMRKNNGIPVIGGVPQQIWMDRRNMFDNIYNKSLDLSKKGVIYTTYSDVRELVDNFTLKNKKEYPKWYYDLKEETGIEIRAMAKREGKIPKYIAKISGSKYPNSFPDGEYDITNKRLVNVLHGDD